MITLSSAQLDAWIMLLIWPFARILALIAAAPISGSQQFPTTAKIGLAVLLATLVAPTLPAAPPVDPASLAGLMLLARETLLGVGMGLAMRVVFSGVSMAGDVIGLQMGLGFAQFYDAQTSAQVPVIGQFLGLLATLVFLSLNGHLLVIATLVDSFRSVPVDSATYSTGGEEEPGRSEKLKLDLPPNIRVKPIGKADTLAAMLRDGGIDALYTARMPSTYHAGGGKVRRLFESYMEVEQAYYRKTKIFPIMHTVAIKRSVYEKHPWVAMSLYKAFAQAQAETYDDLYVTAALKAMLPWLTQHVEDARALMGDDFWPYGFAPNRATLATFLRYHHEQGLSTRLLEPEELFAPETLESFVI